ATMGSLVAELFLLLLISAAQVHAAGVSFYGDGYIHLRTTEASVQTSLQLRFRTSSQAGLLFLAVGSRDFLLLELISGHLQVRLDLGSGQLSLRSEKGLHLGDLAWHTVELSHHLHNVTMSVDGSSLSSLPMPGPDVELSIQSVFVGGTAGLRQAHSLGVSSGFRGCLDRVLFNQHDLTSGLGPYSGSKSIHEVLPGCSSQFFATEEDAVGFLSSKAFVALQPWEGPQEGAFECEMLPSATADDGVILFTSDKHAGLVAMEIRDGHVVATVVDEKGKKTELRSLTYVHGNKSWHNVQLHLLASSVQLKVGQELVRAHLSAQLRFHPRGPLLLGGLDEEARGEASRAGLMSAAGGSFRGCLRGIRLNGRRTGLPHAAVTKEIGVGCRTSPVLDPQSTTDTTEAPEVELPTTLPHRSKGNMNFLSLKTLEVAEGGRAPLEPRHIKVNLDFQKLDLHPSQLMFRVEGQPVSGELRLDLSPDSGAPLAEEQTVVLGA
uniref:Laminin G domain-containing protein n=1 Tax=Tetraodon nigroviridis TaxID=99883 RepID=H3D6R5_TETNG